MDPGLTPADCQVAECRHRELVSEGQRQQIAAATLGGLTGATTVIAIPRQQVGQNLRSARISFRAVGNVTREHDGANAVTSPRAIA